MNSKIPVHYLENDIVQLCELFKTPKNLVLTTHLNPDADAIGSTCALALALRAIGSVVRIVNASPTPENFQFLAGAREIEIYDPLVHNDVIANADLVVCLDLNVPQRTGSMSEAIRGVSQKVIMIDHHSDPADFHRWSLHDTEATSTAELIYKLLGYGFAEQLNAEIATNIYAGIMADSGNFRFPRVCAATHYIIAELIEYGADPVAIYDTMYNSWSIDRTRLIAEVVSGMKLYCEGRFCVMKVSKDAYSRHNCTEDAIESAVQQTLSIKGVRCGVLIAERETTNEIKLSFRSKGEFLVNQIAATFGGGGHIYAAGARMKDTNLDAAVEQVLARVEAEFKRLDDNQSA